MKRDAIRAWISYVGWIAGMIGIGLALFAAVISLWYYNEFVRPPISTGVLRKLRPGMTQAEVRQIVGPPHADWEMGGEIVWCYYRNWTRSIVNFDTNGIYRSFENEGD